MLQVGLSALGLVFLASVWFVPYHGGDLFAYWTVDPVSPYVSEDSVLGRGVFRYAPPVALLMAPLSLLPWEVLLVAWMGLQLAALWYIAGWWFLALVLFPPVYSDLVYGNINIFLGAVIVAGFRYPSVWNLALLTKITPGVGIVWFLVRREWRSLAAVFGVTAGIVLYSVVIQGTGIWFDWLRVLSEANAAADPTGTLNLPLAVRVVLGTAIIGFAGLTDKRWLVPFGVVLAMPVVWLIALAPLCALGRRRPLGHDDRLDVGIGQSRGRLHAVHDHGGVGGG